MHVLFRIFREFFGDNHIKNSGYLEVAELNSIIMVFPQAHSNTRTNQIGCWDTYGIAGPLYATQRGPQVRTVRNMISRVLGEDHFSQSLAPSPAVVTTYRIQEPVRSSYIMPTMLNQLGGRLQMLYRSPSYFLQNIVGGYAK